MGNSSTPQKNSYKVIIEKGKTYFGVLVACPKSNLFVMGPIKKKENLNLLNFWQRKVKSSIFVGAK